MKITELDFTTEGKRYKWDNNILIVKNGDLLEVETNTYLKDFCIPIVELLEMEFEEVKEMKNPYTRVVNREKYYSIGKEGSVEWFKDDSGYDNRMFNIANYFNNRNYAEYVAFKENLMRRMDRFAWENNEKVVNWNDRSAKYYISFSHTDNRLMVDGALVYMSNNIYFESHEIAVKALEEFKEDLIKLYTWKFDF